ncbi:MAG: GNAT family N-acetyltransferase [Frankiaceae bacterium]|nr:GNAT family N-acetyltransferase [Frankiaceae bacterium]MBV9872049.1 GNAT family N-acetyltransferase [Frankiaceae bacterium]
MSHTQVLTRVATHDDLPVLLSLWDELRVVGGRAERAVNPVTAIDIRGRLPGVLTDPLCRVVIAAADGEPVGMAVLQVTQPDPLSDAKVVQIAHIVVARSSRHRGVGHALVATAVDFANERHIDHIAASVYPSLRDASRFYARLGFAPVVVRRIAPVSVLRRRLSADRVPALFADAMRLRTRLPRSLPVQQSKRMAVDQVD